MAIMVTGGAGYIGGHSVLALLDRGYDVVVVDDLSTGRRETVPDSVTFIGGSIGNPELLDRVMSIPGKPIDAVLHFAGSLIVPESVTEPIRYYENNVVNSLRLIQACVRNGVHRVVFSSSAAVYGIPTDLPVRENSATLPINPYGRTKLMTEQMLTDASVHGIRSVCLRYFNVAGADPMGRAGQSNPGATALIKIAAQVAVGLRKELDIYGIDFDTHDGTGVRDYIHVSDLADAHVLALEHLISDGDSLILNCGYGRGTSVLEVVHACERIIGHQLPVKFKPRRPGDPPAVYADTRLIRAFLRWKPVHADLAEIVQSAIDWERRARTTL